MEILPKFFRILKFIKFTKNLIQKSENLVCVACSSRLTFGWTGLEFLAVPGNSAGLEINCAFTDKWNLIRGTGAHYILFHKEMGSDRLD
jgi:hypothetical protein